MLFLVWVVATAVCAGTLWLIGLFSGQTGGRFGPAISIPLVLAFILFFALLRGLRLLALPLRDLIDAAQRVEAGDLTPRVRQRGPRELRALARAFNSMLDRLLRSERQRRQLLADVTHELRTPVAVLQGNLEGMLDGVYPADAEHLTPLLEETRMLARLIDDLRTLSLAESGVLVLHREPTDLGVLLGEVAAAFRAQAESAGVELRAEVPDDCPLVEIDPLRLREVLVNLVANALRHTPRGGEVRISASLDSGRLRLSVVDNGTGHRPRRFAAYLRAFLQDGRLVRQWARPGDRPQPGAGPRRRDRGRKRSRRGDDDPHHASPGRTDRTHRGRLEREKGPGHPRPSVPQERS